MKASHITLAGSRYTERRVEVEQVTLAQFTPRQYAFGHDLPLQESIGQGCYRTLPATDSDSI